MHSDKDLPRAQVVTVTILLSLLVLLLLLCELLLLLLWLLSLLTTICITMATTVITVATAAAGITVFDYFMLTIGRGCDEELPSGPSEAGHEVLVKC